MASWLDALTAPVNQVLARLPVALLTLVVGFIVIQLILLGVAGLIRALRLAKAMEEILQSAAAVVLWIGVVALVLQSLGLNQVAIAVSSSLAIIGLGLAAGANKLVADIVAGLFLAKNRNFKIGQRIKIDTIEGQIHSLDARKVRILAHDGTLFVIPNAKFDEQIWHVLPQEKKS